MIVGEDDALALGLIFIFLSFGWIFYNVGRIVSPDE